MRLTAKTLQRLGACSTTDFERVFPKGATLRRPTLAKASRAGLKVAWLKDHIKDAGVNCCPAGSCDICDEQRRFIKTKLYASLKRLFKLA